VRERATGEPSVLALEAVEAKPLRDLVFVDVETGGFDETRHALIEVAAVRVSTPALEVVSVFDSKIVPVLEVTPEAAAINGYDPEVWKREARFLPEVLDELDPVMTGAKLAGQNPDFDARFLRYAFESVRSTKIRDSGFPKLASHHAIDTASLAWPFRLAGLIPNCKLATLVSFFGLGEQSHTAFGDVIHTIQVYRRILDLYRTLGLRLPEPT